MSPNTPAPPDNGSANSKRTISPGTYLLVFVVLMLLLAATAGASFLNLGPFNSVVAIGIAAAKALLILLYFMHLRVSNRLNRMAAAAGFVWLGILFTLSLSDFFTRSILHIPGK